MPMLIVPHPCRLLDFLREPPWSQRSRCWTRATLASNADGPQTTVAAVVADVITEVITGVIVAVAVPVVTAIIAAVT